MAQSVLEAAHFHDEVAALAVVEARIWPNGPACTRCGEMDRVGRMQGRSTRLVTCKCYVCRKPFTVTVGTVMESSHIPLHIWLQAIHLLCASKTGMSSNQLHRVLGVTLKSAWFLSHRIREAMADGSPSLTKLGGGGMTIERDETFIGGKAKNRAFGPIPEKKAVAALVERGGKVRSFHVPNVTADNLYPIIARHTHADSRFMTDESGVYEAIGATFKGGHLTVNHSEKEYVRDDAYAKTAEGHFSILKRGIYGVYQHVSEAHLKRYLAEFDFRYNHRVKTGYDDGARADLALKGR